MPSSTRRTAARKNVKMAAAAAKRKRTIAHLPKKTRAALGKGFIVEVAGLAALAVR